MKLLGSTESKITGEKNGENVPHLEVVELILIHCNIADNSYEQNSRILYTFAPNKPFGSLLEISPPNHFLKNMHLIQNFRKSKYGLQIKIMIR